MGADPAVLTVHVAVSLHISDFAAVCNAAGLLRLAPEDFIALAAHEKAKKALSERDTYAFTRSN